MAGGTPSIYSIAAHRGFADALAAGLLPRYRDDDLGLARLTLLLPSTRAVRTVTEAFVRLSGEGLLLPRMAVVGDLDLDETLGPLLDPLGEGAKIPPAADPVYRWLKLAEFLALEGEEAAGHPATLRQAARVAQVIDRLLVEDVALTDLIDSRIKDIVGELSSHWTDSTRQFAAVLARWQAHLAERGEIDAGERRNRLFDHAARRWKDHPPRGPIVAAGVTSAAPALARMLRVIADLPDGSVILPDFDLTLDGEVWEELGRAGIGESPDDPPFAPADAVTHPQYHLKLLLNRMNIAREEVQPWHRAGLGKGPPERSHAVGSLFLPPQASARWAQLPGEKRRLSGVQLVQSTTPQEEAQAIALLIRETLEEPERRVALVTPDRSLARRVVAHLERWNIRADDSAGQPLSLTPAGRLLLAAADLLAERAAPVSLVTLLGHPFVARGDPRGTWLRQLRQLEAALRGPRRAPGLAGIRASLSKALRDEGFAEWWSTLDAQLADWLALPDEAPLADLIDRLIAIGEQLADESWWAQADGRSLSAFVEELRGAALAAGTQIAVADLPAILLDRMGEIAVRPPYGGHPRVAIYGLLEARMTRADLVICAGLNEGSWPAAPALDPVLPPPVLRALGVPGADFRIGLAAHDLAGLLGAPQVVLSRAARDAGGPTIPSRFLLRVEALLGETLAKSHTDQRAVEWAAAIDRADPAPSYPVPQPKPTAAQRRVRISVTALDRLRSDPYQFYASHILRLRRMDALDAEPNAAWQGMVAHAILEKWHAGGGEIDALMARELEQLGAHPLVRALWQPRLAAALEWVTGEVADQRPREVAAWEVKGRWTYRGVELMGVADRIDRLPEGTLAIVDYKTGSPPSKKETENGYRLQLGTLGLIAEAEGFETRDGRRVQGRAEAFEYWSLGKKGGDFGYVATPLKIGNARTGIEPEDFLPRAQAHLDDALDRWILGDEPFTATIQPDAPRYADYDQLMRLAEWYGRDA